MAPALMTSGAVLALLAGTAQAESVLHILHTNDFHSRVESINRFDATCDAETEEKGECFGGTARLAAKLAELRAEFDAAGEPVILLDAGDQFQGSLFYTTYKGKDTAEFMNRLGYDAMAVGNHEFDDGPEALAALIDATDFPILAANIDVSQSNVLKDKLLDSVVIDLGGDRIGVIGATTIDTPNVSSPGAAVIFQDEAEAVAAEVERLTAEGVTKIIALTHMGYDREQELAAKVPGLDAVVGGHSHTYLSSTDENAAGPYPT
ncbi:MAG: metallophosphoesterase, partial [Paracoccus sp. (in: a-proteobacteria)]|nr:metallophosphoesterase [Paracoccus sp. (in: a-proteobacteria)]